jgi:mono/diheme cytochrome c family protein
MKKACSILICIILSNFLFAQSKPVQKTPTHSKSAAGVTSPSAGLKASIERGQIVYKAQCLACHQSDGGGVPNMNPPLIKTTWVLGDKKKLVSVVMKGLNDPIVIEDEEFHNPMPPHTQLTDQQIADVLTFVRNNFGNKASAVTPAEVKAVRAKLK